MMGLILFAASGAITGLMIGWALDFKTKKELIQSAVGGCIVGIAMALMIG